MAKDVEGYPVICEYCNTEFGLVYFVWSAKMHCGTCGTGSADIPCEECGITPDEDGSIRYVCKPCQIEHGIVVSGEDT